MKKILGVFIILISFLSILSCSLNGAATAGQVAQDMSKQNAANAQEASPIPLLTYFQERRTIDKWARYWDKANLPTFVYLFVFDKCIGYYVADGKPASTRSYLIPERQYTYIHGSYVEVDAPDIDGTYGDNNPGIRFFTASGIPVEFGGAGASYLYSASILPLDVPKLDMKRQ